MRNSPKPVASKPITVYQKSAAMLAAPLCAQCRSRMQIERIEPNPPAGTTELLVFRCSDCGLSERLAMKKP
jgi:hypothetical protein